MALANYGDLQTAVENWLADTNLTTRIPEFIALGEGRIYSDPRLTKLRVFENTTDLTISSSTVALPTRYIGARRLYLDGSPRRRVEFFAPEAFWERNLTTQTGAPKMVTVEGENLEFAPGPDTTYTGKFLFYNSLARFSDDSDTNTLLTNTPNLYLYSALIETAPFLGDDPRIQVWAAMYDSIVDNLNKQNKMDRFPTNIQVRNDIPVR